ncbi:AGAP012663-PA-like protein [Anopheles sinensis]|uniref:AGAP012663-PA-like protein n=1 Tax=Anopheles sinensis TaxID=74873 RepID=A0A084VJI0_ANOSI|nr:AGAP012663-PA-like protein [Anopheles sinensis]
MQPYCILLQFVKFKPVLNRTMVVRAEQHRSPDHRVQLLDQILHSIPTNARQLMPHGIALTMPHASRCADGYMGPRCEYKDLDGSYLPTRPRIMLETASIASGAIGSLVLIMIGWCCWCVRRHQRHKRLEKENGVDTVDAPGVLHVVHSQQVIRPFGAHHLKTIPMSEALKR